MHNGILFIGLVLAGMGSAAAATGPMINRHVSSEVVMRCDAPAEFSDRHQYVGLEVPVGLSADTGPQISLLRQPGDRYDVLVGNDSLTGTGKLSSMQDGNNPVHLVLDTVSGMEHFLFVQNKDGSGELLWSSATASALTTCTAVLN